MRDLTMNVLKKRCEGDADSTLLFGLCTQMLRVDPRKAQAEKLVATSQAPEPEVLPLEAVRSRHWLRIEKYIAFSHGPNVTLEAVRYAAGVFGVRRPGGPPFAIGENWTAIANNLQAELALYANALTKSIIEHTAWLERYEKFLAE